MRDEDILKLAAEHRVPSACRDEVLAFAQALLALRDAPRPRQRDATLAAIAEVDAGRQVAPTARKHGIQPSTLFRALARRRVKQQGVQEPLAAPTP